MSVDSPTMCVLFFCGFSFVDFWGSRPGLQKGQWSPRGIHQGDASVSLDVAWRHYHLLPRTSKKLTPLVTPRLWINTGDSLWTMSVLQMWTSVERILTSATQPRFASTRKEGIPAPAPMATGFWKASA